MALRGGIIAPINKERLETELGIRFRAYGTGWRYDWQSDGMLARVVRPDGKEVSFAYDALGRRIRKSFAGTTTQFVWDGNVPLHEWTEESEMVTWFFEQDTFVPAAKLVANGECFFIVSDYLGTPMQAYDKQGDKVWEQELDIYGRQRKQPSAFLPFKYQGQYEDAETGLYYNRFRYYDPNAGSYISQDPIGLKGGNPTLYACVKDSNNEIDVCGLNVFWSGGVDAQNAARIFAKQKGDTILEMTPHGQALEEWTKNLDWETEAKPLWQKTSKDFAGSTVGEAHVFIYEPKYRGANSVWEQDELPILKKKGIPVFEHKIDADGNIKVKQIHH